MRRTKLALFLLLLLSAVSCNDANAPKLKSLEVQRTITEGCPIEHPSCLDALRDPTVQEELFIRWTADRLINHWDQACGTLGWLLLYDIDNNRIQAWDGYDYGMTGDWHGSGAWINDIHIWQPFSQGTEEFGKTLIHEAAHAALGAGHTPIGYGAQYGTAEWYENYCWSNQV